MKELCKLGLPTGNVFEFAAQSVLKYEAIIKKEILKSLSAEKLPKIDGFIYINSEEKCNDDKSKPKKSKKETTSKKIPSEAKIVPPKKK